MKNKGEEVNWHIESLRPHVLRCENKDQRQLDEAASCWLEASAKNKIDYEIEWFGIPVIQTAEDMILMQELIFTVRPDYVVETGIAHGGNLIFYASMFELLGRGEVIGVDIEIRQHNRRVLQSHPFFKRIRMIEGDSTSEDVVASVANAVGRDAQIIVCLDSNHYKQHVLEELKLYSRLVKPGGYIVVFDTVTADLAVKGVCDRSYVANGPMEAINDFLEENDDFIIDKDYNRLWTSTSRDGYLKRVK